MEKFNSESQRQISIDDYLFEERDDPRTHFYAEAAEDDDFESDDDDTPIDLLYQSDVITDNPNSKDPTDIAETIANKRGCSIREAQRYVAISENQEEPVYSEKDLKDLKEQKQLEYLKSLNTNAPSVRLDERKVAIQGLMGCFDYMNGKKGFSSDSGRASARNTYKDKTLNNMNKDIIKNISTVRRSVDDYYNQLMGGDKVANDNIDEKNSLRSDMYSKYGVGHANSHDRKKLVKSLYVPVIKNDDSKEK